MSLSKDDVEYIQQAYRAGMERGRGLAAAEYGIVHEATVRERLEGAVGFSIAHVEKYSEDQSVWAMNKFREENAWRRGKRIDPKAMIRRMRQGPLGLTGMDFTRYFPSGPELGVATATGNIFVSSGLTNLTSLWLGLTRTAAINTLGSNSIVCGSGVCGVGTGTAAPAVGDVSLISTGGSAWFQNFDANPSNAIGVVTGTTTYGTGNANFAWNEWCWATGSGVVTAQAYGSTTTGSPYAGANSWAMVNHKTNVNLGSKAAGSSWVFSTTFTIS